MILPIRQPSSPRVLLVEDEPALRDLITIMLEDLGALVTSFPTADEGLQALPTQNWALLITDVRTPGRINGVELAVAATKLPITGIILMSGYHDQLGMPLPTGINFLAKPWPLATFLELVVSHLHHQAPQPVISTLSLHG